MIGPNVIQKIIDDTGNNWMGMSAILVLSILNVHFLAGFPFLFAMCACAGIVIWVFVDVEKGRKDALEWAESAKAAKYEADGIATKDA